MLLGIYIDFDVFITNIDDKVIWMILAEEVANSDDDRLNIVIFSVDKKLDGE